FRSPHGSLYSGNVEPLQRGDEIGLAVPVGCIHYAEFQKHLGLPGGAHRAETSLKHFETCHCAIPCLVPVSPESPSLVPWKVASAMVPRMPGSLEPRVKRCA